jgi:hypothetical protein
MAHDFSNGRLYRFIKAGAPWTLLFSTVFVATALYWRKIFLFYFPGSDEWIIFVAFATIGDAESLLKYFFSHWNQHLVPLFKLFFYLEYRLFGLEHVYYHWVTIALFSLALTLFYRFLRGETVDNCSAALGTVYLGCSVVYYPVVIWMFHHQVFLTLIFLELALIRVSRGVRDRDYLAAGALCLLSSLFYAMGVMSWPVLSVFYASKCLVGEGGAEYRTFLRRLFLIWAPAAAFVVLYYVFSSSNLKGVSFLLDPVAIARHSAVLTGNIFLMSLGVVLSKAIPLYAGRLFDDFGLREAIRLYKVVAVLAVLIGLAVSVLVYRGRERRLRPLMLSAFALTALTSVFLVVARGGNFSGDVIAMSSIPRYNLFPFIGMVVLAASVLSFLRSRYGRRAVVPAIVLILILSVLQQRLFAELVDASYASNKHRRFVAALIESDLEGPGSRYLQVHEDLMMNLVPYEKLFVLFKREGDVIRESDGRVLLLRDFKRLLREGITLPGNAGFSTNGVLEVSPAPSTSIRITPDSPGRLQHLFFRMKSDTPSEGRLIYTGPRGAHRESVFAIPKGWAYREYVLPCPDAADIELVLGGGEHRIKDLRLYR